jgi:hypothetical protein
MRIEREIHLKVTDELIYLLHMTLRGFMTMRIEILHEVRMKEMFYGTQAEVT